MKKTQYALSMMLPVMALTAALCFASQVTFAHSAHDSSRNTTAQQPLANPPEADPE